MRPPKPVPRSHRALGAALLAAAVAATGALVALLAAKLALPPALRPSPAQATEANGALATALRWARSDEYACLLLPLTFPVALGVLLVNWWSLQLFKRNA